MTQAGGEYLKGLDGIRGLAMATVVLTHMHLVGVGWITIQIFFVLSGFLITRILLSMREQHGLGDYLKIFYARRTLRIFPIYYLFLLTLWAVSFFVPELDRERRQIPYALAYVWNWYAITDHGGLAPELEHFWSLAVEEQFYLLWPLLLFFARGTAFWKIAIGIVVAGPLIRLGCALAWPQLDGVLPNAHKAIYQMSTTHLDAFAVGALLCYVIRQPWSYRFTGTHLMLGVVAAWLLGSLASGFGFGRGGPYRIPLNLGYPIHMADNWQFVWGYSVINLLAAGLILLVAQGRFANALFMHPFVRRMGVISYAAYIFHLGIVYLLVPPIKQVQAALGSVYLGTWLCAPLVLALVFGLAELSYRFFESRFLVMKDRQFGRAPVETAAPSGTTTADAGRPLQSGTLLIDPRTSR
ncbi:acyltransferase [Fontimonas sp. SYSU GA230001]|uniref:acyltransferase family protein n=1 Tax=Fontimonas sp. SYSU GA230001 TaxID=3142450 RepID=UPI0032B44ED8